MHTRVPCRLAKFSIALGLLLSLTSASYGLTVQVLHSFAGTAAADGSLPYSGITLDGTTLYGTTIGGGNNYGTVFKLNTDGSGYSLLKSFTSDQTTGNAPWAGVTVSGSTLFGATEIGGAAHVGNLFTIDTSGNNYTVLHPFNGTDGAASLDRPLIVGSTLYTTTSGGGTSGNGAVVKIGTDGTGFSVIHSFDGINAGQNPYSRPLLIGNTLYGSTLQTGSSAASIGTLYKVNTDGSGFQVLHTFSNYVADGYDPYVYGGLTLVGSKLYGTTTANQGAVFSLNLDGSGYKTLHLFGAGNDGGHPQAGLIQVGSALFGTTTYGGRNGDGTIYQINPDGSGYQQDYAFSGSDGANPFYALTLGSAGLYGTTSAGGNFGNGTVFFLPTPEPTTISLVPVALIPLFLRRTKR